MKRISYTPEDIERDRSGFTARQCLHYLAATFELIAECGTDAEVIRFAKQATRHEPQIQRRLGEAIQEYSRRNHIVGRRR